MSPTNHLSFRSRASLPRRQGSILVVAMVFSVALGILTAGYLRLALSEFRRSEESLHFNGLVNLAEAGAEEAVWALVNEDMAGWLRQDTRFAWKRLTGMPAGAGREGSVLIMIDGYQTNQPTLTVEARVRSPRQRDFTKQIRMQLQNRSLFANGLTAREKLRFVGGNAAVDSYNSNNGAYHPTTNRRDRGTAGSLLIEADAVDIGNGNIWGYIATGGGDPSVGSTGSIRGADTEAGVRIDWSRVARDFYADFPPVTMPSGAGALTELPAGNNKNIGIPGVITTYRLSELTLRNSHTLNINGPVVLQVTGDIDVKGTLNVNATGSVTIYADGDINVGGNGMVNLTNIPSKMILYGTNSTELGQEIKLHGNGAVSGVVYAPNALLSLKGGGNSGEMFGAVVAFRIFMNGNYAFHYDEALDDFGGGRPTFRLRNWQELVTPSEKVNFARLTEGLSIPTDNVATSGILSGGVPGVVGGTVGAVGGALGGLTGGEQ